MLKRIVDENQDKVLSGVSAGSICWFEAGQSDSESYESVDGNFEYIEVK